MKKGLLIWIATAAIGSLAGCGSTAGRISLTWDITIDGAAANCSDVSAAQVEVVSTNVATGEAFHDLFTCSRLSGRTSGLPAGDYDVDVILEDSGGSRINSVSTTQSVPVDSGRTTDAGHFAFPFVFPKVRFTVHMGSAGVTGGNCASTTVNGAGVALEEIDILSGNQCIDTASVITSDTTASTCETLVCQETDMVHEISGLPAGSYTIQVFGLKGAVSATATVCYASTEMPFTLGTSDVNVGQIFAPFDPLPEDAATCNATKPGA